MRIAVPLLFLAPVTSDAVVIRDDVPDLRHRVAAAEFPQLVDLSGEGHGVLIAPTWVLTAAHAVSWQHSIDEVVIAGSSRAVERVRVHPGYRSPPPEMIAVALASGDWTAFFEFVGSTDDIALIELSEPVLDISPARLHTGPVLGKVVRILGKGATGSGSQGPDRYRRRPVDRIHV